MSSIFTAGNINYATPSFDNIANEGFVDSTKYFSLHDNILDGSYKVLGPTGPFWNATLSDATGLLNPATILYFFGPATVHALHLKGDAVANAFPVNFDVTVYKTDGTVLLELAIRNNDSVDWVYPLNKTYTDVDKIRYTFKSINRPNYSLRLTNTFEPHILGRADALTLFTAEAKDIMQRLDLLSADTLSMQLHVDTSVINEATVTDQLLIQQPYNINMLINANLVDTLALITEDDSAIHNSFATLDNVNVDASNTTHVLNNMHKLEDLILRSVEGISAVTNYMEKTESLLSILSEESEPTNVHTRMKESYRKIYGKCAITYTNPFLDTHVDVSTSGKAYNSSIEQIINSTTDTAKYFTLYDNNLEGAIPIIGTRETGWVSNVLSNTDGTFTEAPRVQADFTSRLVASITIMCSESIGTILVDFTVTIISNNIPQVYEITNNTLYTIPITTVPIDEVTQVVVEVHKVNKPNVPAVITEIPIINTVVYSDDRLISMDLLEELSYDDEVESLGGVSANEITVTLSNEDKSFYFNNASSAIARQLKKNRKIVPYLGVEIIPGEIEWYCLGTYWSFSWSVPVGSLTAKVVGFDTIGLLGTTEFKKHRVYVNESVGSLLDIILNDAKLSYNLLEWYIEPALYEVIIPYAWFAKGFHMAALERLAQTGRFNIYCDRNGKIIANMRYSNFDYDYANWSDSTNIVDKSYPTLYTSLPNTINVSVYEVTVENAECINYSQAFDVSLHPTLSVMASSPIIDTFVITVICDETVSYTYSVYSWGIDIAFTGTGRVTSVKATANCVMYKEASIVTNKNELDIIQNGTKVLNVNTELIQTVSYAKSLADIILSDASIDIYDTEVNYRGDIALSINDPIYMRNGIAPTDKYFIKRHELLWEGTLAGRARLNT